ncbi:nicotinate-nucleotide adenylyltransferase [Sulfuriflexus mobilis]|uniref:nicotinate-nucleotide adenylyltransferase n=1 Tax=Sulfuriflexus mobilis TaxID=1811807 RepID=UPI000F81D328|nr:nicotinate-nucleotide adenylyltransferase [Sulfuriflexus mobilis]
MKPIGILGGTFDPVHCGHLRIALDALQQLGLQEVRLLPCRQSPLRDAPRVTAGQRLAMLEAAIAGEPGLVADGRELQREGPSFSVDTLRTLRADYPDTPLCLIVGMDAFIGFAQWKDWRQIFALAHIVVVQRPGSALQFHDAGLQQEFEQRRCQQATELAGDYAGKIFLLEATYLDISATQIRALVAAGNSARYLLPDAVWQYIQQHGLYQ